MEAEVLGVMEIHFVSDSKVYGYEEKFDRAKYPNYTLPDDAVAGAASSVALTAWRALQCADLGRIDVRCDDSGKPNFVEVNPIPGLREGFSDLPKLCSMKGIDYSAFISLIMANALGRHSGNARR